MIGDGVARERQRPVGWGTGADLIGLGLRGQDEKGALAVVVDIGQWGCAMSSLRPRLPDGLTGAAGVKARQAPVN